MKKQQKIEKLGTRNKKSAENIFTPSDRTRRAENNGMLGFSRRSPWAELQILQNQNALACASINIFYY